MCDLPAACNKFFSDPRLGELLEINKRSSDLLDLLNPLENQHSDILAWCLNSREGHDQGDAVLKDFLVAIYNASTDSEPGDRLYGKGLTKDFVRYWTPGRITTSSFGSAIFLREYPLPSEGKGKNRIDLLIIDPDQQILVVVENKSGSKLPKEQLTAYLNGICQNLFNKPMFKDFNVAFVALDQNYDPELDEDNVVKAAPDRRWAILNYEWLNSAAKRAEHAIKRGNHAAALLRSYCFRQSTQIEYADARERDLIHKLAGEHSAALQELKTIRKTPTKPELLAKLRDDSPSQYLLRMYLQNQTLLDKLIDLRPIDTLDAKIRHELGYLAEDNCERRRVHSSYRTAAVDSLPVGPEGEWPLYIHVRHTNELAGGEPLFRVGIRFRPQYLIQEERKVLIEKLSAKFPTLSKSHSHERGKWISVVENRTTNQTQNDVVEMAQALTSALKPS